MAVKKTKTKTKKTSTAKKRIVHRHFRPSYDAHPIFHIAVSLFILTLIFAIISVWMATTF